MADTITLVIFELNIIFYIHFTNLFYFIFNELFSINLYILSFIFLLFCVIVIVILHLIHSNIILFIWFY